MLTVALMLFAVAAHSAEHGDDARLSTPENLRWQEGPKSIPPGAKLAVLEGDPAKDGPFVMRLLLPDGYKIPAHTHPKIERLTVISGAFHIVMGDNLDPKTATKMPAGPFGYWPAGMKHVV
jgi:anti-sigma factor ChrR (cupin superfamily)